LPQPGTRRSAEEAAPAAGARSRAPAGWPARLRAALGQALDLPRDLIFDLPRVTLLGNLQLSVENHRGLLDFRPDRVAIATRLGHLVVVGADLTIGAVREGEITVTGILAAVRFEPAEPGPAGEAGR
jgi:sporulation protein YqfC